jgi:23S rRNA G2445 N2-methylase RlmL
MPGAEVVTQRAPAGRPRHRRGHRVEAAAPLLEHIAAGMPYVLGDLPADDTPSAAPEK